MAKRTNKEQMPLFETDAYYYNVLELVFEINNFESRDEFLAKAKSYIKNISDRKNVTEEEKADWLLTWDFISDKDNWSSIKGIKTLKDAGVLSKQTVEVDDNEREL